MSVLKTESVIHSKTVQIIFSFMFLLSYIGIIAFILYVETSDTVNMKKGQNSFMGELKLLLGVLTAGLGQILNFWFSKDSSNIPTEAKK